MKRLIPFALILVACGSADPKPVVNNQTNNSTNNGSNNSTNNQTVIDITQFDQSCEFDQNCEIVQDQPCGCNCPTGAINVDDLAAYSTIADQIVCPNEISDCACPPIIASCWDGMCGSREPFSVRGTDYATNCVEDEDCIVVHDGEICSDCKCGGTAVNAEDFYASAPENPLCTPAPQTCECVMQTEARCVELVCVLAALP